MAQSIEILRQWCYEQAKISLGVTATVSAIIIEAKKLERYIDVAQTPEIKSSR